MKTKEFIKRVEELGYKIIETSLYIFVDKNSATLAMISKEEQYKIETFKIFNEACADELFSICFEYASTPIEERKEEEEKFYLQKMKSFYEVKIDKDNMFLILDMDDNSFFLSDVQFYDKYTRDNFKTQFTQKEIDKIKEEQHTDLSEFKQIPVEEVEE